jgi:hypothetical protein
VSRGDPALASPHLPGDRVLSTEAQVAALDLLLDEFGVDLTPGEADLLVQYAAVRYARGEVEGARATLGRYVDLTGVYRLEAVLHTT